MTRPTRKAIAWVPLSRLRTRVVVSAIWVSSCSVACNSASRLRVRSSANSGLRHTTRRSPGNASLVTSSRLRSSNSEGWNGPFSRAQERIDTGLREHAPVAHPGELVDPVAVFELRDLGRHGSRIGGGAREDFHCARGALR